MKWIDPKLGPRADLFRHFRGYAQPAFTLCAPVRVDGKRLKADGGLFGGLLWAILDAAQTVPELRQRLRVDAQGNAAIVEHAQVDCSCTVGRPDGSFAFGSFPYDADRGRFLADLPARIHAAVSRPGLEADGAGRDDLLYLSCVPWMEISAVQHAWAGDADDSVPRILWGRVGADQRATVCVTAHHSLVDGLHIARFLSALEARTA
jgi:chloramphenicol O-acetyltransferase type A